MLLLNQAWPKYC